jgi:hypothetical protein
MTQPIVTQPDPIDVCYFRIELADPQINFLDTKNGGSLVCCTGLSSLEGWHHTNATICRGDGALAIPKRKNEIRLRMNNVSAFTASTNVDGDGDVVYWRTDTTNSNKTTTSSYVPWESDNNGVGMKKKNSGMAGRALKMAVEDFKIRASYTFWTVLLSIIYYVIILNVEFDYRM